MARENKIICAAIKAGNVIIPGIRHFDKNMNMLIQGGDLDDVKPSEWTQGFIDRYGEFHNREDSMKIAKENGQHINYGRNGGDDTTLYSEGIY